MIYCLYIIISNIIRKLKYTYIHDDTKSIYLQFYNPYLLDIVYHLNEPSVY